MSKLLKKIKTTYYWETATRFIEYDWDILVYIGLLLAVIITGSLVLDISWWTWSMILVGSGFLGIISI